MKYLIYVRVSTDQQDVETQIKEAHEYINSVNTGKKQVVLFSDPDTSSRLPIHKRPGLVELLKSANKNDVVIVYKMDRISRSLWEFGRIYQELTDKKASLYSVKEPNLDKRGVKLFALMADFERDFISERTKSRLQAKKARGERVGTIPYGYRLCPHDPKKIEPDPTEQETLAFLNSRRSEGATFQQLADECQLRGIVNRRGNKFARQKLWEILDNLHPDYRSGDSTPTLSESCLSLQRV